ncbi:Rib/alpha-like domain-containing protein [Enterococcus faecalis]|uniref:Rib/alpha-like domain-containing protein n=1 Tax=Enterococcus faecalis TaxID=1351 RepID=UPI0035CAD3B7
MKKKRSTTGEVDLTDNVTNLDELPTGTEVKDITPEGVIDTTQPGEYEGTIEITYPDGTSETEFQGSSGQSQMSINMNQ